LSSFNNRLEIAGCELLGGETSEMPGMYRENEYELAGFAMGIVETKEIIDGTKTEEGYIIVGIHSNGYSLVTDLPYDERYLTPTKIYTEEMKTIKEKYDVKAIANITGGGFMNIHRAIPDEFTAIIHSSSWEVPEVFRKIQKEKDISRGEMYLIWG
jgi:phosphoribosylformylglycinamidine cyclo-ligase